MWPSPTVLFFFFFFIVWRNPIDAKLFWNLNLFVFAAARLNWRHTICAPQQLLDCPVLSVFARCARCGGGETVCGYVSTWLVSTTYVAWRWRNWKAAQMDPFCTWPSCSSLSLHDPRSNSFHFVSKSKPAYCMDNSIVQCSSLSLSLCPCTAINKKRNKSAWPKEHKTAAEEKKKLFHSNIFPCP